MRVCRLPIAECRFKAATKDKDQRPKTKDPNPTPLPMLTDRVPKILIISSDTGGGHRSAAAAIVAGVQKFLASESYAIRVVKAVEESHHLSARLVRLYNWILCNRQHWMKYFYW